MSFVEVAAAMAWICLQYLLVKMMLSQTIPLNLWTISLQLIDWDLHSFWPQCRAMWYLEWMLKHVVNKQRCIQCSSSQWHNQIEYLHFGHWSAMPQKCINTTHPDYLLLQYTCFFRENSYQVNIIEFHQRETCKGTMQRISAPLWYSNHRSIKHPAVCRQGMVSR